MIVSKTLGAKNVQATSICTATIKTIGIQVGFIVTFWAFVILRGHNYRKYFNRMASRNYLVVIKLNRSFNEFNKLSK
jgi:peroxiredoxin family protein